MMEEGIENKSSHANHTLPEWNETVSIEYTNSLDDVVEFNRFHFKRRKEGKLSVFLMAAIVGVLCAILGFLRWEPFWIITGAVVTAVGALVDRYFLPGFIARGARRLYQDGKNKGTLGWHRLLVSNEGLREENEVGASDVRFDGVENVSETESYVYIYVSAVSAHIVPRKGITKGDLSVFLTELNKHVAERVKNEP